MLSLSCHHLAYIWSILQPHKSGCFGTFPEAQLWVKERSLQLQRTIHSCQKLAVCGTQSTAAVFPEYWQLLWQPESVRWYWYFWCFIRKKKSLSALCLWFPLPDFIALLLFCIPMTYCSFLLKLGNYKISSFEIKCLLSSGFFLNLPEWTESS